MESDVKKVEEIMSSKEKFLENVSDVDHKKIISVFCFKN